MNFASVERIAAAVLYEGYILYPYRSTAVKNRQRCLTQYQGQFPPTPAPIESGG
jgi:hypothetical protein